MAGSISTLVAGTFDASNSSTYTVTSATYTAGRLYIMTIRNRRTAGASESPSSISGGNASNVFSKPANAIELTYQSNNNYLTTWFMYCAVTETTTRTINFTNTHLNCSFHVAECTGFDTDLASLIVQQRELLDDTNTSASLAFNSAFGNAANHTYAVMDYAATGTGQSITADGNMTELANPEASGIEIGYLHVQTKASEEATVNWTKSNTTASGMGIMELRALNTVSVTGAVSVATADGHAGVVAAQITKSITGEVATAAAVAHAGVITANSPSVDATVTGEVATASAAAIEGAVQIARSITGEVATATAAAHEGAVSAVGIVAVAGEPATASAAAHEGVVTVVATAAITGVVAEAAAEAHAAEAHVATSVTGVVATASAAAIAGVITALVDASIVGETATAAAAAHAGVVTAVSPAPSRVGGDPDNFRPRGHDSWGRQVQHFDHLPSGGVDRTPDVFPPRQRDVF